jgi:hypothetical protein
LIEPLIIRLSQMRKRGEIFLDFVQHGETSDVVKVD